MKTFSDKKKSWQSLLPAHSLDMMLLQGREITADGGSAPQEGARNLGNCKHISKSKR